LLRTLGYRVLSDINAISVVMPTALIGCVLLTSRSSSNKSLRARGESPGIGKPELVRRVEWLAGHIRAQGGRVSHFGGLPTSTVVERGLEVLGPKLVRIQRDLAEETYHVVDAFQLSFYRNMTIHLFISQALVCAACYANVVDNTGNDDDDHSNKQKISFQDLKKRVHFYLNFSEASLSSQWQDSWQTWTTHSPGWRKTMSCKFHTSLNNQTPSSPPPGRTRKTQSPPKPPTAAATPAQSS